jgi:hypothetical protein
MNEKIKELASDVGAVFDVIAMGRHDGVLFTETELEKFAKKIIRECITLCDDSDEEYSESCDWAAKQIKKHFGFE